MYKRERMYRTSYEAHLLRLDGAASLSGEPFYVQQVDKM